MSMFAVFSAAGFWPVDKHFEGVYSRPALSVRHRKKAKRRAAFYLAAVPDPARKRTDSAAIQHLDQTAASRGT